MAHNGNGHPKAIHFDHAPTRVVSLVPSITESLFDLGMGAAVVGITDYCNRPADRVDRLPRLGGPKNPRVPEIVDLKPELVIANWEENTRPVVEAIEAAGVPVWVTFPQTVQETLEMLYTLAALFRSQAARLRLQTLELTLDWAISAAAARPRLRYFCPIWYDTTASGQPWWMTFNQRTYCSDLLARLGAENVFARRERRYPLGADLGQEPAQDSAGRDTRYPRLTLEEIRSARPELVLLPDEPYAFGEAELDQLLDLLAETPAGQNRCIFPVDGSLITWAGTRMAHALRDLPAVFDRCQVSDNLR